LGSGVNKTLMAKAASAAAAAAAADAAKYTEEGLSQEAELAAELELVKRERVSLLDSIAKVKLTAGERGGWSGGVMDFVMGGAHGRRNGLCTGHVAGH